MKSHKTKILYIITKSDIGGAQKYIHDLSTNINKEFFESKIIFGGIDIKSLSNKTNPGIFFWNDWQAIFEIVKILKKETPDIIHLNSSKAGVLGTIAGVIYRKTSNKDLKIIFTAHGWVFNPQNKISKLERFFYIALHKAAGIFQNKIINVSNYDREIALRLRIANSDKLKVVWNGIGEDINFLNKNEARNILLQKIQNQSPVQISNLEFQASHMVGSIGRLVKEKDYETLISSAKLENKSIFIIIGDGYEKEKLNNLIKKYSLENRFFILKNENNDARFLKAFDIFILSSVKEGLPYTLLEAMSARIPIIGTKTGGITEILNNENGILVNIKNTINIAEAINNIKNSQDLKNKLINNAFAFFKHNLTLKNMIENTEKIYLE
ncbi:MAG: glycosyltransferase [Candidatus Pacebacteria bacterium]|nr:glycosyltransferase [Candidatus Paceibacterota bacterium]